MSARDLCAQCGQRHPPRLTCEEHEAIVAAAEAAMFFGAEQRARRERIATAVFVARCGNLDGYFKNHIQPLVVDALAAADALIAALDSKRKPT